MADIFDDDDGWGDSPVPTSASVRSYSLQAPNFVLTNERRSSYSSNFNQIPEEPEDHTQSLQKAVGLAEKENSEFSDGSEASIRSYPSSSSEATVRFVGTRSPKPLFNSTNNSGSGFGTTKLPLSATPRNSPNSSYLSPASGPNEEKQDFFKMISLPPFIGSHKSVENLRRSHRLDSDPTSSRKSSSSDLSSVFGSSSGFGPGVSTFSRSRQMNSSSSDTVNSSGFGSKPSDSNISNASFGPSTSTTSSGFVEIASPSGSKLQMPNLPSNVTKKFPSGNGFNSSGGSFGLAIFEKDSFSRVLQSLDSGILNESGNVSDKKCRRCDGEGHFARDCDQPPRENDGKCRNCSEEGHFSRDCPQPKKLGGNCFNCGDAGHNSRGCTKPRDLSRLPTFPCRHCSQEGHWARDCVQKPPRLDEAGNPLPPPLIPQFRDEEELFEIMKKNPTPMNYDGEVTVTSTAITSSPHLENFEQMYAIPEEVMANLKRMNFAKPTAIQGYAFHHIFNGEDVLGCAHTGCGKTAAYLLPIVSKMIMEESFQDEDSDDVASPRCLILAPSRELAVQIFEDARRVTFKTGVTARVIYGETNQGAQMQTLTSVKKLGILVATMGRLRGFLDMLPQFLSLKKMKYLVLDEGDRMITVDNFGCELKDLIETHISKGSPEDWAHQTVAFSASFNEAAQLEVKNFLKPNFVMLGVAEFGTANSDIHQEVMEVETSEKVEKLFELLGIDFAKHIVSDGARVLREKTLIFVNVRTLVDTLAALIQQAGIPTTSIHSLRHQSQREEALGAFKEGKYKVLVASNVAARGLDIRHLDHVINFDLPPVRESEEYINRIGRTGRAGSTGTSTTFFCRSKDLEMVPKLIEVLTKAGKVVPEFLTELEKQVGVSAAGLDEEEW
ncbi:unnamed protein product [Caenorhabditis auriculariae]|uniref:RNA helicase n=1 Tax=Caenorhabditis auriculariae TaxID=2777116 RepID=A0A8S1GU09_9PELO|nr:unnamed protein product [Caenorhabditis auriculariae]